MNLRTLDVGNNFLTGVVPFSIGVLKTITTLKLNNNYLTGSLKIQTNLTGISVDISNNFITGPVYFDFRNPLNYCSLIDFQQNCILQTEYPKVCAKPNQKTQKSCNFFCNAARPIGACNGRGVCLVCSDNCNGKYGPSPTCKCDTGFVQRNSTCVTR